LNFLDKVSERSKCQFSWSYTQ